MHLVTTSALRLLGRFTTGLAQTTTAKLLLLKNLIKNAF